MSKKKYVSDIPNLLLEWDWTKNDALELFPHKLSLGSQKKAWWKCKSGHSWDAQIKSRVAGTNCRYCSGQAVVPENSLATKFPEISKQWDYDQNYPLTPNDFTSGSSRQKRYWLCPNCGQSYQQTIYNRTQKGQKCPYCNRSPKASKIHNLLLKRPDLSQEWDYEKNHPVRPEDITPQANKKYYWKCSKGHSYLATPNNRYSGDNCPFCSGQQLSDNNRLSIVKPELAKQWHPNKNKLSSSEVSFGCNDYAWWICPVCHHEWEAKINNRSKGRGCPNCAKGAHSSFPEQVIFHYVKELFPDTINRYLAGGKEIDIFIPSLNIGIEYDGGYYHKTLFKFNKDREKNEFLSERGIFLIRIRETECYPMPEDKCKIFTIEYTADYHTLTDVIATVIDFLCSIAKIPNSIKVDIDSVKNDIIKSINVLPYNDSFAAYRESNLSIVKAFWDYELNYPLMPEMVKPMSGKIVHWVCNNNSQHRWQAPVSSISNGYGCSWCAGRHKYTTEEWIEQAVEIHGNTYDYSKVCYVNSKTKVTVSCPLHGEFQQNPSMHLSGNGCPWCAGQGGYHNLETLALAYPELAKEWDYEHIENKGLTPEDVVVTDSKTHFYWKCTNGKPHSFHATIPKRIKGLKCAVCHGKQVSYDTSLEYCRPDLVDEWHKDNIIKPNEVSCGSEKKILWKCKNPNHPAYVMMVYNRTKLACGCMLCSGHKKDHKTFEQQITSKYPNITLISKYNSSNKRVECKCSNCNKIWSPIASALLKTGCYICKNIKSPQ